MYLADLACDLWLRRPDAERMSEAALLSARLVTGSDSAASR